MIKSLQRRIGSLFESVTGLAIMAVFLLGAAGGLYWLWIAIQIGSFFMFVVGMVPIFYPITALVGAWALLFGVPEWVFRAFG